MSDTPLASNVPSPPPWPLHLDRVCDRFEEAWLAGQRPRVEEFLRDVAEPSPAMPWPSQITLRTPRYSAKARS
jgi:hypothetical protein